MMSNDPDDALGARDPVAELEAIQGEEMDFSLPQAIHTEYISGVAGSGKTYTLKKRIEDDYTLDHSDKREYAILCSTTGISACNLGTITLNSTLGYFNTESLADAYMTSRLHRKLIALAKDYQCLCVDEISMMCGKQLDYIYRAATEIAGYKTVSRPLGLVLTGDYAQLAPIPEKDSNGKSMERDWAFNAMCWPEFESHRTHLTKIWRQSDPLFLDAINLIRAGNGHDGAAMLQKAGVEFVNLRDLKFDGTTILAKNKAVDKHNFDWLMRLPGRTIRVTSARWGKESGGWNHIPQSTDFKIGAYVMILSNDSISEGTYGEFRYSNGDCGHIEEFTDKGVFKVKLIRTGQVVEIGPLTRSYSVKKAEGFPDDYKWYPDDNFWKMAFSARRAYYDEDIKRYVLGQVKFYPLRLAYASTCHKTQSLTIDKVQCDIRDAFFSEPGMVYTALSRVRTPQGLRIVGTLDQLAKRTTTAEEVRRFI